MLAYFEKNYPEIGQEIETKKVISDELGEKILKVAEEFKNKSRWWDGKCKRDTKPYKQYPGYDEDNQRHVHDFLLQVKESKESAGGYGAVFLFPAVCDLSLIHI